MNEHAATSLIDEAPESATDDPAQDAPAQVSSPIATAAAASSPDTPQPRSAWPMIAAAVAVAAVWAGMYVAGYGSFDALLGVGPQGPSRALIEAEIEDLALTHDVGHDGQQFYVIARHPFDPQAVGDAVEPVAYRYRRILFPLIGTIFAPDGGRPLIAVFLIQSLVGVALGAWALSRLPRAPSWLPVTIALTPGVVAAVGRSLSDALAAGLGLVAVTLATERRWTTMILVLVAAALTRETLLLVAAGLVFTPGMPWRIRIATLAIPGLAFATWSTWVSWAAGSPPTKGGFEQFALPMVGWMSPHVGPIDLALGLAAIGLLAAAAWRARRELPHVAVICGLGALLLVCLSDRVTFCWINSMRPVAPMMPLAVWVLFREPEGQAVREESGLTAVAAAK
jgi:hypothetical protein